MSSKTNNVVNHSRLTERSWNLCFSSVQFSKDCLIRFKLPDLDTINSRSKLSSTNDYYYLNEITCKTLIAPIINLLQIFTFYLIIQQKWSDPLHHEKELEISLLFCIYPIIAITLSSLIFSDMSIPLKICLQFERNRTVSEMDWMDYCGVIIEGMVILQMCIATVLVTNEQQSILDMLFNFTGLGVVLGLDNIIIQSEHQSYLTDFPRRSNGFSNDCYESSCCRYCFCECCGRDRTRHIENNSVEAIDDDGSDGALSDSQELMDMELALRIPHTSSERLELIDEKEFNYSTFDAIQEVKEGTSHKRLESEKERRTRGHEEHEILRKEVHRKSVGVFLIAFLLYIAFALTSLLD